MVIERNIIKNFENLQFVFLSNKNKIVFFYKVYLREMILYINDIDLIGVIEKYIKIIIKKKVQK